MELTNEQIEYRLMRLEDTVSYAFELIKKLGVVSNEMLVHIARHNGDPHKRREFYQSADSIRAAVIDLEALFETQGLEGIYRARMRNNRRVSGNGIHI